MEHTPKQVLEILLLASGNFKELANDETIECDGRRTLNAAVCGALKNSCDRCPYHVENGRCIIGEVIRGMVDIHMITDKQLEKMNHKYHLKLSDGCKSVISDKVYDSLDAAEAAKSMIEQVTSGITVSIFEEI